MSYVLSVVRAIIAILGMIVWITGYSVGSIFKEHTPARAFAFRKHWLKYIGFPVLNIDVKVEGKVADEPAIYVCNHRSFVDPVVLCGTLDAYVIAKAEIANYPIINKGAEITGVLYVKREDKASRNSVRDLMIETVKKGHNVLVFPEGTVGVKKGTLDFRPGTFFEAAENNIPIVPVAVEFKSEKDLWLIPNFLKLFLSQFSKWKTEAKLSFGPPLKNSDGEFLRSESQKWVNEKLSQMHENWSDVDYSKYENFKLMYNYKN
jgi:1-acyl-sn-glycerol-3-phosphate acyltransferase